MRTLVVTEKPNVAERIANSLGNAVRRRHGEVSYYEVGDTVVAPAVGHIYGLRERNANGWTYPVFDVEWVPSYMVSKESDFTKKYLDTIKSLAKECGSFINACDYDVEGEVIGYNVIKHGCGVDPLSGKVGRVKYSTLTKESILKAFEKVGPIDSGLAYAGLTRHVLDWYWGINLSRALTNSARTGRSFSTLSIGRVQGPTLKLLAVREHGILAFKPEDYWEVEMLCSKGGDFSALHDRGKFKSAEEAQKVKDKCGPKAVVSDVESRRQKQPAPHPFDLTTLQTEAYKHLGVDPRRTLEIAQSLYTNAYISYPRTSSQVIPDDIDCRKIIADLMRQGEYKELCSALLGEKKLIPAKGDKTDPAHPAIHPTGEAPPRMEGQERGIYDLIVRRFLAAFGQDAVRQTVTARLDNSGEPFTAKGSNTVEKGWHVYYGPYAKFEETELPHLEKGDVVDVREVKVHAKQTQPPKRYTPASIIKEMEKRNLGTKATRSQIVDILFRRGYVTGKSLEVSQLGLTVVDALDKYCPEVISESLTRKFEEEMESITEGKLTSEKVLEDGRGALTKILGDFKKNQDKIGQALGKSIMDSKRKQSTVGKCPRCGDGDLVIRSSKLWQFIGCSNYPKCTHSWSLPKDPIEKGKECKECGYSTIAVKPKGRRRYALCVNPQCPTRANGKPMDEVGPCPRCKSKLLIRTSRYGGQFIGCSGYPKCNHIWPLPRDPFEKTGACGECGYPRIAVSPAGKEAYEVCVNPECKTRKKA
jgi:DNA topoisomerase I